jgi:hypothetical protein
MIRDNIPDPDIDSLPIQDPDPGSGTATLELSEIRYRCTAQVHTYLRGFVWKDILCYLRNVFLPL